jgi:hypothetical protein
MRCWGLGCAAAVATRAITHAHASRATPIEVASYRILGIVGFGIDLHARSRKRGGWFRKAPEPREIGQRLGRLVGRMLGERAVRHGWKQDRFLVELRMHPAAPLATLSVETDGDLVLRGETAMLGPGYHADAIARIGPLLEELEYAWSEPVDDLPAIQAATCAWLAGELREHETLRLGVPRARRFQIDAPVLTPLGPRDARWRDGVIADPAQARDAFPWWERGPGRAELASALVAMWLEVPWREPLDREERELMTKVDEDLRAARKADPSLPIPWAAWKELLAHIGIEDEDVLERAQRDADGGAPIGYRRHDLDVDLSGGWSVRLPGAMVGHWEDDGARYWATDGDRVVEFTSFTADGELDSERLLAVAPEKHAVIERFASGAQRGRAEAFDDEDVHVVIGLMAAAPHVGILTCKGADDGWALATWRSLRHDA